MSSINRSANVSVVNHTGLKVSKSTNYAQLERMVLANMLWEDQFYFNGVESAEAIKGLAAKVTADELNALSLKARDKYKLRHIPLLLQRYAASLGKLSADVLADVIQRPDEMGEFLSMYWKEKRQPLSNQVKKGLAKAFCKFNEYQLAKWDKNSAAIRIRDVMFMVHPKPQNADQAALFKKVAEDKLETPDTWEVQLSAGADKKETFTRLMNEKKLGALAFIRNLRNMVNAGVDESKIRSYAQNVNLERVLPFRFIAASRQVPALSDMLESMMFRCLANHQKIPGKTVLVVDVSGSMFGTKISEKSDLDRFDAAAALAMLCREVCEEVVIFSFSNTAVRIPSHFRGFQLVEAISSSQHHGGTKLGASIMEIHRVVPSYDRCIVFTDEQSYDRPAKPKGLGYIVNVAAYRHGINIKEWQEVNGFSEAIVDYIYESEALA